MPASPPVSLHVRDLARRYGNVEALRGVSFSVNPGEIFGLLGPNGAGKTTALECILGLRRPDSGMITVGDVDAVAHPEAAKRLCGAQLQNASLQDKITPRRALRLFSSFYTGASDPEGLIERFGLSEKAESPFDALSSGQRQRLFLALAFVNTPAVVVLDEPTTGLDPAARRDLHDLIAGLSRSGRAILLSTHDLDEARHLCTRIGILDRGRILAEGSPEALVASCNSQSSIEVQTTRPLDGAVLESLPGVRSCRRNDNRWVLATADVNGTIQGLVRCVEETGNAFVDLKIVRPSLEDVFLSLTGRTESPTPCP